MANGHTDVDFAEDEILAESGGLAARGVAVAGEHVDIRFEDGVGGVEREGDGVNTEDAVKDVGVHALNVGGRLEC